MTSDFEALVVDYGGVLTSPMSDAMQAFADDLDIDVQDLVRAALGGYVDGREDSLVFGFETGRITEEEFTRLFAQRLSEISGKAIGPEGLVGRIFRLELEHDMLIAVANARAAGMKTGLLSNSWGVAYYPMERLEPIFDTMVISGEVGLRKPDPQIYELVTQRLGVAPAKCVFVDDHPGHLKAALESGMTTVLHRGPAETIAELERILEIPLGPKPEDARRGEAMG